MATWYWGFFSRLRQSSSVIFHCLSGFSMRALNRASCSSSLMFTQNLQMMAPQRVSAHSNSLISSYARRHSASVAKPSTRSTSTRPYQVRS